MAGVSTQSPKKGGRRSLDSEINMIPMIDLFIVCISFLLITAVWSQMARMEVNAAVPGKGEEPRPDEPEKTLTVSARGDSFVLSWKSGATVHETSTAPRSMRDDRSGPRYPELAREIAKQWERMGTHRNATDPHRDRAILDVDDHLPFEELVAMMDAIHEPKRVVAGQTVPVFALTFASR